MKHLKKYKYSVSNQKKNFKMQLVIFKDIKKTFAFTTIFNYKTKQIFEKF